MELKQELATLTPVPTPRERHSFWCSESEKLSFDIYHEWMGTPYTNPVDVQKEIMFEVGKQLELGFIKRLQEHGLAKQIEAEGGQVRVDMEREGIRITGYIDGMLQDGTPVEVKSFYGPYQAREIRDGKAKTSYIKQIAMYMDFLDVYSGKLVYLDRGTGEIFEFDIIRSKNYPLIFKCGEVQVNLGEVYKGWAKLYTEHIATKVEPKCEERYKVPVEQIDFSKVSKSALLKASRGQKVIGDGWRVLYSPYKDLIIEREGATLGYDENELAFLKRKVKNI